MISQSMDLSLRGFSCPWGELTILTSKKPILTEAVKLSFLNNRVISKGADGILRLEDPSPLGESGDCNFSMTQRGVQNFGQWWSFKRFFQTDH